MEGESYLTSGFGIRLAMEAQKRGWLRLEKLARVWQPNRLKGIVVGHEYGTAFLAATQVFDVRPVARKWLSFERTPNAAERFVRHGSILVTCSGSVGRATLAHRPHDNVLISHDLLRVDPADADWWGWIYAYLRSSHARQMMVSAHYGHIIKHLETSHLNVMPVPAVRRELRGLFSEQVTEILKARDRGYELSLEAERLFESAIGSLPDSDEGEEGFVVRVSELVSGRRRLDAWPNNPRTRAIRQHLEGHGNGIVRLADAGFDAWLPTRFRRIQAADGVELLDSSKLFEINPDPGRRIADIDFGDPYRGRVKSDWLLLSRSGQIYGLLGSIALAHEGYENRVISDDIIRIKPKASCAIRPAYAFVALSHPTLGRPYVKSLAYGSSIPHLEPADVEQLEIIRLDQKHENAVADLAETGISLRRNADSLEVDVAEQADHIIKRFLSGDTADLDMNV